MIIFSIYSIHFCFGYKCYIQTKMYTLYMTIYDHFSLLSVHFVLESTQLLSKDSFFFESKQKCYKEVVVYLYVLFSYLLHLLIVLH